MIAAHATEVIWAGAKGYQWVCRSCHRVGPDQVTTDITSAEVDRDQHIADSAVRDAAEAAQATLPEGSPARQVVEGLFARIGVTT